MTDAPTNVIDMKRGARLIREAQDGKIYVDEEMAARLRAAGWRVEEPLTSEAQEAREKRKAERAAEKPAYPGGIDDLEV